MYNSNRKTQYSNNLCSFLFIRLLVIGMFVSGCVAVRATSPTPTPTPTPAAEEPVMLGSYKVTSTTELGWRFRSISGNMNQYQSNLNYGRGFRVFDTNLLLESNSGKGKYFDSLLISASGWGSDPSGYTRVNMEKTGIYKFNATVRRVTYFNSLSNHALNEHTQDWRTNFGDFDLRLLPQDDRFRFFFGVSYADNKGPGMSTIRGFGSNGSDEFAINAQTNTNSVDYRFGAEGKLFGFDYGLSEGIRSFHDRSYYSWTGPINQGNNPPPNTTAIATFFRSYPVIGHDYFTQAHLHRTFAQKLDFTARFIYTSTTTNSSMTETITGRDSANNIVDLDNYSISGRAKRPQTRTDLGVTYNVTDKFRISDTFSFDQFAVNGGEAFFEQLDRRNGTTFVPATLQSRTNGYHVTAYKRFVNTVEADYQINNAVGFHIGYRYTHRQVAESGFDTTCSVTVLPAVCVTGITPILDSSTNHTNTLIAGMKIKPVKSWVIFWDVEKGQADNVFTRLENYKFTNFRVRTRYTANKFGFNFSAISKNNSNPSMSFDATPVLSPTSIKGQVYSGTADWTPRSEISFSGGYTYNHLTTFTPIRVPATGAPAGGFFAGTSQFFVRDSYIFFDVSARPVKRLGLYASYRIDVDRGQGSLLSATPIYVIITSYPMQFTTPEVRAAFRVTRNIEWNVGYQFYDFRDIQTPSQNYRAHLPYTSVRIYFGQGGVDR